MPIYMTFVKDIPEKFCNDQTPSWNSSVFPEGLEIHPNFISEEEELTLLSSLDTQGSSHLKQRQVWHYGKEFIYGSNTIAKASSRYS